LWRKDRPDGLGDFEEIHEKKTTLAGIVLLVAMSIFLIIIGETVFSDLKRIPTYPTYPSYCVGSIIGDTRYGANGITPPDKYTMLSTYRFETYRTCDMGLIDRTFALDTQYTSLLPTLKQISDYNEKIGQLTQGRRAQENAITQSERSYDLSLQEKMAREQVLYSSATIQANIATIRSQIAKIEKGIEEVTKERNNLIDGITTEINILRTSYNQALKAYERAIDWYQIKLFVLMLLFVAPFFIGALRAYFSLKRKNSPYTIIATAVLASSTFLFLQTILTFLYEIIPHQIIELLISFFSQLAALRYILYYGSALLVIALFGGIVYLIQKNVFNSHRVAIRRLKDNKCPHCSFSMNHSDDFCPVCGELLKVACGICNKKRLVALPFCPSCGKTKNGQRPARVTENN
jgi:hypothetical protein